MKKYLGIITLLASYAYCDDQVIVQVEDPLYVKHTSSDFIQRWLFQKYCDFVFDPRTDIWHWPTDRQNPVVFNPKHVKRGDVIFVRNARLFFEKMHPLIEHPYIMVTHGDHLEEMHESYEKYMDEEKLIAWFGIHPCDIKHPKFHPIPIGVVQDPENLKDRKRLDQLFATLRQAPKEHLLYMNFAYDNKPERVKLRSLLAKKPYVKRGQRQPFTDYLKEMATCKFTLSPCGLAIDCYRTWEALLVGSIPIVKRSVLDPLFEDLPVLIINDWDELNEEYLNKKYEEITSKKYDISKLYMKYWKEQIEKVRDAFLRS